MSRDPSSRDDADGTIEALLGAFVERRERGERLTPEQFLREHPSRAAELASALRGLADTEAMFASAHGDLPERVGPYRVLGEVGRGGMGRVLRVEHDERPGELLALKLLHQPLIGEVRALERFRREGRALAHIAHPSVVKVHDAGLSEGRPYIAMELVEGSSLATHVQRARERVEHGVSAKDALELPGVGTRFERIARVMAGAARAIAAAHVEDVLHRDLNPRNVLLRASGEPVVIDFGLMRSEIDPTLTGSGDVLGTPQYMAPEQARGERVDARTDVFGLGVTLRELLSLEPPREPAGTVTMLKVAGSRPLAHLRRVSPDVPRELATIADRATAFVRRWRYASAEELALDLERWLAHEPIRARPASFVERAHGTWSRHPLLVSAGVGLVLTTVIVWWSVAHGRSLRVEELASNQELHAVFVPWLDGDTSHVRELGAAFLAKHPEHPFADFVAAVCADDFDRSSDRPMVRALLAGERARRAGRPADAARSFATALDIAPDDATLVLLQGIAELEAGDLAAARNKLERSAFYFGGAARLHQMLAELYLGLGEFEDASRASRAALQLAPDHADTWLVLARARAEVSDFDGALGAAREVLRLDPRTHTDAIEALAFTCEAKGGAGTAEALRSELARSGAAPTPR